MRKCENVIIERVEIKDAEELLSIYAPYVKHTAISFEYEVPSVEEFECRIRQISSKYPYLKAVENGHIVGYAYANTFKERKAYDWSVETTIYLRQDEKGRGIGRLLYHHLEEALKEMGIMNMNACIASPVSEDEYLTDASSHFHESMGFEFVGRFHNSGCKFGRWYDMVWMEKLIGDHSKEIEEVAFGEW